jgi:hypothetical protein
VAQSAHRPHRQRAPGEGGSQGKGRCRRAGFVVYFLHPLLMFAPAAVPPRPPVYNPAPAAGGRSAILLQHRLAASQL